MLGKSSPMENHNHKHGMQTDGNTFKNPNEGLNDSKEKSSAETAQSFSKFVNESTLHGVKYIFQKGALVRRYFYFSQQKIGNFIFLHQTVKCSMILISRILWLLITMIATCLVISQAGQRTSDFFQYKTNVDVKLKYNTTLEFPSVTICNQNNYR